MPKKKTFEIAKKEISEKYPYLKLLKFNENNEVALFLDKDYGEFEGNYRIVLRGQKNHQKRSLFNKKEKTKNTNLEKYGVENPFQSKEVKEKIKKINLEKYGVENPSQANSIKNKKTETFNKNYGVEHYFFTKEFKNIRKETWLNKYGSDHIFKSEKVKEKIKQTNLERYGVEYPQQNKIIREKTYNTNLKKYGVKHIAQNKEFYNKIKKTNLLKYSFERALDNDDVKNKSLQTKIKNGNCYNISGKSLSQYYNLSELSNIRSYSSVQQQYKIYGNLALNKEHFSLLSGKSRKANLWLDTIEKELGYELIREYHIPTTLYHTDGYDPKTNTIYEFYGDFWHGNIKIYIENSLHPIKGITYEELYNNTIERQNKLLKFGYNIIYVWEDDFIVNT